MQNISPVFLHTFIQDAIDGDDTLSYAQKVMENAIPVTEKSYLEMTEKERNDAITVLLTKRHYYCKAGVHIAYGREQESESIEDFLQEFSAAKDLVSLGYAVYLLPSGCAKRNNNQRKIADTITDGHFLEIKHITGKDKAGQRYSDAKKQGQDVYIAIENKEISKSHVLRTLYSKIRTLKKEKPDFDFAGKVFLHFAHEGKTYLFLIQKNGVVTEHDPFRVPSDRKPVTPDTFNIP